MDISMMTIYLIGAVVTALGAFAHSMVTRGDQTPAPRNPVVFAVLAGVVWPIVLVGVAQFAAFIGVQRLVRWFSPPTAPETPLLVEVLPKRPEHLVAA